MRSTWKAPVFNPKLIFYKRPLSRKRRQPLMVKNKAYWIYRSMVGRFFVFSNGRRLYKLGVQPEMVGHRLGEFGRTREKTKHNRRKREKALAKKLREEEKKLGKNKVMSAEQKKHIEEMKRKRKKRK